MTSFGRPKSAGNADGTLKGEIQFSKGTESPQEDRGKIGAKGKALYHLPLNYC